MDISDNTRKVIWKYLQLILFSTVSGQKNCDSFGDTAKLFEAIDEDEFKKKLEESINEIYSQRKKFYNESNFRIKCNSKNKEETIHKIIKLYDGSRNQI